MDKRRKG